MRQKIVSLHNYVNSFQVYSVKLLGDLLKVVFLKVEISAKNAWNAEES